MQFKFSILLLLVLLFGNTSAWTDKWKYFDKTNGLPTDRIRCVVHDMKGNYWIGILDEGLVK